MQKNSMIIRNMTSGDTVKLIVSFAVPLLIGNIFQQVYGIVDTMVAGYTLGDSAIAAIGATSSLFSLIIDSAWGINSGFEFVITRLFGANDEKKFKNAVAGMAILNAVIAGVLMILSLFFMNDIFHIMNIPSSIYEQAYSYMIFICIGIPATSCYNMFASIMRSVGNSKIPLVFLIISSILNIVLDILFVVTFNMGVAGAAFATTVSQALSAIMSGYYVVKHYKPILPQKNDVKQNKTMVGELVSSGIAMGLMMCVVDIGTLIFQSVNNTLGDMLISAHTAARRIIMMITSPMATLANATATFIGQNYGAGKYDRIKEALRKVITIQMLFGAFVFVLVYFTGEFLAVFTTGTHDKGIIENAVLSMRINLLLAPALGVLLTMRVAMQTMGRKIVPVVSSSIELIAKILSAMFLVPQIGFLGTCMTEPIIWFACMVFMVTNYLVSRKNLFV